MLFSDAPRVPTEGHQPGFLRRELESELGQSPRQRCRETAGVFLVDEQHHKVIRKADELRFPPTEGPQAFSNHKSSA